MRASRLADNDTSVHRRVGRLWAQSGLHVVLLVVLVGFSSWLGYVGFLASDDEYYSSAAIGWLDHFPYVGTNHWGLRHAVVLPVALSFWLGGINELSMMLPLKAYLLLLMLLTYACLARLVERKTALLASALIALTPIFALPSSVSDDVVECFFVAASFWAFYFGSETRVKPVFLVLCGIGAGLAFVTRETSASIGIFYGLLFVRGWRVARPYFFLIAGGFLLVLAIDTVYLAIMTDDPYYRFHASMRGLAGDNPLDPEIAATFPVRYGLDRIGLIGVPRAVQPVVMLLTAHQLFPLFFFVFPAGLWLWKNRARREREFEIGHLSGLLGLIWFLTLSYLLMMLWLEPRYQTVTVYCAIMVVALWFGTANLRSISWGLVALLCIGDLLMIYLDNKSLMFAEKTLVSLARSSGEPIYTDPATFGGASFLLNYMVPGQNVIAGLAPAGGLFFYNPSPARRGLHRDGVREFEPRSTWALLQSVTEQPKISARVLRASGLEAVLPLAVAQKLDPPLRRCYLYRLPWQQ